MIRNIDEQLSEIMNRAEVVKKKRSLQKNLRMSTILAWACLILLTVLSFYLPKLNLVSQENGMTIYGSLFLATPYIGYVIVGILAFALGISVTLLCIFLKKLKEKERE